jgi:ubiquinone/menaquinone biosynthesis C-methylase UbiE
MGRQRIIETDSGIQGEFHVKVYDAMLRRLRDKGWMETSHILQSGIQKGCALEIGPGPGYLGLEWLSQTDETELKAVEISPDMIQIAQKNAKEYGLEKRVTYIIGDAANLPFEDRSFDAVFSNGSLHEWSRPLEVFNEVYRVLKVGGRYFISDLRRNMNPFLRLFMKMMTRPKEIKPGLVSSINASYTLPELESLLGQSRLEASRVEKTPIGLEIIGEKRES